MNSELMQASPDYARTLTDRIKIAIDGTWQLIIEAYQSRSWAALGYRTWDDYCTREFGSSHLRLPREERQEQVASLREAGLSIRAIVSATGLSDQTVQKDIRSGVVNHYTSTPDAPAAVQGMDGKTYSRPETKPAPKPDLDIINDIRLYLRHLSSSPKIAALPPAGKQHIIDALSDAINQLQRN